MSSLATRPCCERVEKKEGTSHADLSKIRAFHADAVPPGSRVLLLSNDQPKPVPDGTMGTLTEVDSAGRFLVNWDNGKRTALNMEDDHFRIFQSDPMELKLYFPLHGELYTRNEWGDLADDPEELAGSELAPYLGDIREALQENQLPEEQERGLMHWYRESDSLSWKVKSAFFDVENTMGSFGAWRIASWWIISPRRNWTFSKNTWKARPQMAGARASNSGRFPWAGACSMSTCGTGRTGRCPRQNRSRKKEGWTLDKVFKVEITNGEPDGYLYATQLDLPASEDEYAQAKHQAKVTNFVRMEAEVLQVYQGRSPLRWWTALPFPNSTPWLLSSHSWTTPRLSPWRGC